MSTRNKNAVGSLVAVYFFISSIVLIKSSAVIMGESLAEKIVLLIERAKRGQQVLRSCLFNRLYSKKSCAETL